MYRFHLEPFFKCHCYFFFFFTSPNIVSKKTLKQKCIIFSIFRTEKQFFLFLVPNVLNNQTKHLERIQSLSSCVCATNFPVIFKRNTLTWNWSIVTSWRPPPLCVLCMVTRRSQWHKNEKMKNALKVEEHLSHKPSLKPLGNSFSCFLTGFSSCFLLSLVCLLVWSPGPSQMCSSAHPCWLQHSCSRQRLKSRLCSPPLQKNKYAAALDLIWAERYVSGCACTLHCWGPDCWDLSSLCLPSCQSRLQKRLQGRQWMQSHISSGWRTHDALVQGEALSQNLVKDWKRWHVGKKIWKDGIKFQRMKK